MTIPETTRATAERLDQHERVPDPDYWCGCEWCKRARFEIQQQFNEVFRRKRDRRNECPGRHGHQCCNEPDVCRAALAASKETP